MLLTPNNKFVIVILVKKFMFDIEFYEDARGYSDVKEFIMHLREKSATNKDARINFNKVVAYLDILEEMGTRIGGPVTKHLDGEIGTMSNWKEVRNELKLTPEEEIIIELEKDLLRTMVSIREKHGLSQAELADKCNVKQPMIARVEKAVHSPQINSLLKILVPMGYKLEIVPMDKKS